MKVTKLKIIKMKVIIIKMIKIEMKIRESHDRKHSFEGSVKLYSVSTAK